MKWWGWGNPEKKSSIPEQALSRLQGMLDCEIKPNSFVSFDDFKLPEPELKENDLAEIRKAVGDQGLVTDRECRILHSAGKGYPDLIRMRSGEIEHATDAVAYPQGHDQVVELLKVCSDRQIAVIPFGGGTSVVGGVEPIKEGFNAALTLDLSRMNRIGRVDSKSLFAQLGPGMIGPEVESSLKRYGMTLGHFPQSYEYATLGGWVATRSAGQASTGYGSIAKLAVGARVATPTGDLELPVFPGTAAGPQLRELIVGSEGVLGVITDTTMRIHRAPERKRYEAWMFKSFSDGAEVVRKLVQDGAAPDVVRLSDEAESEVTLLMAGGGTVKKIADSYIGLRRYKGGCIAILGYEGSPAQVHLKRKAATEIIRSSRALYLGTAPGKSWLKHRFDGPYLRDELLDKSILVETLETSTPWSNVLDLYGKVKESVSKSLGDRGSSSLVMCHISHLYPIGASLYFTFISPQEPGKEIEQWRAAKVAASDAISEGNGTITHHHAVGRDHRPWVTGEIGEKGVALIRAAKETLDPVGIMNPGKLIQK